MSNSFQMVRAADARQFDSLRGNRMPLLECLLLSKSGGCLHRSTRYSGSGGRHCNHSRKAIFCDIQACTSRTYARCGLSASVMLFLEAYSLLRTLPGPRRSNVMESPKAPLVQIKNFQTIGVVEPNLVKQFY